MHSQWSAQSAYRRTTPCSCGNGLLVSQIHKERGGVSHSPSAHLNVGAVAFLRILFSLRRALLSPYPSKVLGKMTLEPSEGHLRTISLTLVDETLRRRRVLQSEVEFLVFADVVVSVVLLSEDVVPAAPSVSLKCAKNTLLQNWTTNHRSTKWRIVLLTMGPVREMLISDQPILEYLVRSTDARVSTHGIVRQAREDCGLRLFCSHLSTPSKS